MFAHTYESRAISLIHSLFLGGEEIERLSQRINSESLKRELNLLFSSQDGCI